MNTVPCTVGILTFNAGDTLERTLKSVAGFSDIVVADGGSTDDTVAIAKRYGARVITQLAVTKPGPEPRHPINDFSAERNQLLAAAKEDWFLWLDADEYLSLELRSEIAAVVTSPESVVGYELPMRLQSPDGEVTYRSASPVYQMRLFRHRVGGRFQKPIHEKFVFTESQTTKRLSGAWYVPISKPDFATYAWAVRYRLGLMHGAKPPQTLSQYLLRAWYQPLRRSLGILLRLLRLLVTGSWRTVPPWYYWRNRLYSQWVTLMTLTRLYLGKS